MVVSIAFVYSWHMVARFGACQLVGPSSEMPGIFLLAYFLFFL